MKTPKRLSRSKPLGSKSLGPKRRNPPLPGDDYLVTVRNGQLEIREPDGTNRGIAIKELKRKLGG
jgi:hypothetical protein